MMRGRALDVAKLTQPTVRAAIEALQSGDKEAWAALFSASATLFDDGELRSLVQFTQDALGHERFMSIDRVEDHGLHLTGRFPSDRWGDFDTYFKFTLGPTGMIERLDIGQAN
jgi:hypothetical protein